MSEQTYTGMVSAAYLMFSHGLTSAALFILVGFLYSRYGTRLISNFRGLSATMPLFSCFFFLALVANCSLPATANFIGEFLAVYSVVVGGFMVRSKSQDLFSQVSRFPK